jgi:hypothetical protein
MEPAALIEAGLDYAGVLKRAIPNSPLHMYIKNVIFFDNLKHSLTSSNKKLKIKSGASQTEGGELLAALASS